MPKRAPPRPGHLRNVIAQEAARLIADHGIQDYLVAKRKAAERYGVLDGALLPRNTEIEAALRSRQRLFGGIEHELSLLRQRRAALEAMTLLETFEPRLVGPVLSGSATEHAAIQLHLFSDNSEAVSVHLIDRHIEFEVSDRKMRMSPDRLIQVPALRFDVDAETVEAIIFPRDGIRQSPISPVDGKPIRRANRRTLLEILSSNSAAGVIANH